MVIHLSYILVNILCILYTDAQVVIKDAGIGKIQPTDIGMIFYLTLENICPSEMYISVRGVKCCEVDSLTGARDCDSMKLLGGDPGMLCAGKTRNITLIYPNLYLFGRQGVCTVLVVFKVGMVTDHFFHRIPFNTKGSFDEISMKRCPCLTSDQDPYKNCTPVDCPAKYSGQRNFFNSLTKICEPVPCCKSLPVNAMPIEMYDILHNRCVDIRCTITKSDIALIELRRIPSCPVPYILGNMICHHGCVNRKTGECVCHDKWLTTVNSEPEFLPSLISSHMCNIRTGSWTELNKDKLLLTILVMVVMTSLCVLKLFFLICILHFCYKWARSKAIGDRRSFVHFNFGKDYGSTDSDRCCKCFSTLRKMGSKKSSLRTGSKGLDKSDQCQCTSRSQGALARAKKFDKCFQLEINIPQPTVSVMAGISCECEEKSTEHPVVRNSSVQTLFSSRSIRSAASSFSDDSDSESTSSTGTSTSEEDTLEHYGKAETDMYFTTTYTGLYSSNKGTTVLSEEGHESNTQTTSNFSINMEYDTDDLELECSSSSDK